MLIDETHFGARATKYGKVLKEENLSAKEIKSEQKLNDNTLDELEIITKTFNAKIRIHLSGTPYRILMNSEFTSDDIIAFYQFSNIAELSLNEGTCNNLSTYLRTRFARFMHSLAKISQHATSKTYQFVPLQNFTFDSDIDWSKPIQDIDKQLYTKYKLSEEEIEFIESMIKPLE